ncbi:uncharacterized protein LOC124494794 isoform X3 [Dermatophagoides farinae]|uniref:uncharacterized protein LOC124494794 isoform X3 n=1 Tax=Dermatophagoides farinae TaxID=6954 RepID=UPI003F634D31
MNMIISMYNNNNNNNCKPTNKSTTTINKSGKFFNFLQYIITLCFYSLMCVKKLMFLCLLESKLIKLLKFQHHNNRYNRKFSIVIIVFILNFLIFCALLTTTMPSSSISPILFANAFILSDSDKSTSSKQTSFYNDGLQYGHTSQSRFNNYNDDNDDDDYYDFERKLSSTVVKIKYGLLQGLLVRMDKMFSNSTKTTKNHHHHHHHPIRLQPVKAYLGIPYASPPTGALRFMPPVTPAHWRGIRLATELQPLCPQRIPYADLVLNQTTSTEALKLMPLARFEWLRRIVPRMLNQSEDCLYLNIYTPDLGSEWPEIKKSSVKKTDSIIVADDGNQRQVNDNDDGQDNDNYHHYYHYHQQHQKNKKLEHQADSSLSFGNNNNDDDPDTETILNENDDDVDDDDNESNDGDNDDMNDDDDDVDDDGVKITEENLDSTRFTDEDDVNNNIHLNNRESIHPDNDYDNGQIRKQRRQTSSSSSSSKKFPVIVFLTGESYEWNPGSLYDGSILASYGQTVVVTLNFRLGILGFLPANIDGTMRGNYGLMDQVAALHWIQENIEHFGGASNNITIVGHGYGAACAHLLMLSPMAKGLFNRVILMSGSALSPWAIARDANVYAEQIGNQLNCPIKKTSLIIDCLRTRTIDQLQSVNYQVPDHLTGFGPIIDGIVVPQEPRILMYQMRQSIWLRQNYQQQQQQQNQSETAIPSWSTLSAHLHRIHSNNGARSSSSSSSNSRNHHIINISNKMSASSLPVTAAFQQPQQQQQQQQQQPQQSSTSSSSSWFYWTTSIPDLMVGVTRVESPTAIFSSHEERNGISVARRDRLLRTLVRNLYDYHQQAIFYTLINEYTDWTKSSIEHPLNLMDSLMELYADALVVAPLIESLDHHYAQSSLSTTTTTTNSPTASVTPGGSSSFTTDTPNTYFYVFQYQNDHFSKQSYHERIGAAYGDDIAFIFGVPFILYYHGDNYFFHNHNHHHYYHQHMAKMKNKFRYPILDISSNWYPSSSSSSSSSTSSSNKTINELELCQRFISSWINFAIRGNPNDDDDDDDNNNNNENNNDSQIRSSLSNHPRHHRPHHSHHHHQHQQQQQQQYFLSSSTLQSNEKRITKTHDQWILFYGYQTIHTSWPWQLKTKLSNNNNNNNNQHQQQWPQYDTTKRRYLQFGQSSIESRDHYHSHRLSIWLSLIPRLHVPIELKDSSIMPLYGSIDSMMEKSIDNVINNDNDNDLPGGFELDQDQYFYLKHHLLPDHENIDTYDGNVKELPIKIPESKQWQQKHLRRNMTSLYEQQQQMLYGRIYDTMTNVIINDGSSSSSSSAVLLTGIRPQMSTSQQQYARRQIESNKNKILIPELVEQSGSKTYPSNQNNNIEIDDDNNLANNMIRKNSDSKSNNSQSHLESTSAVSAHQIPSSSSFVSETYSTLVYISFIIGGLLFLLNLIIVIGVYLQMKNGRQRQQQQQQRRRRRGQQEQKFGTTLEDQITITDQNQQQLLQTSQEHLNCGSSGGGDGINGGVDYDDDEFLEMATTTMAITTNVINNINDNKNNHKR